MIIFARRIKNGALRFLGREWNEWTKVDLDTLPATEKLAFEKEIKTPRYVEISKIDPNERVAAAAAKGKKK